MKKFLDITREIKDNRNGKVVTFDFDHTIVKSFLNTKSGGEEIYQFGGVNHEIIRRLKSFKASGTTVFIVTSRQKHLEADESAVLPLLDQLKIEVDGVFYTNGEPKAQKLYELGSRLHYDDDPEEHEAIEAFKNLHPDFNISVKYPDDLIKDTNDISKGVIFTADGKIIIGQRSDSYEWDAPGGHIMEGEEPSYGFWREVKEELGFEVQEVQFLDTLEIEWKGKDKLGHYFFGRIDKSSDELEGFINLQWEVADYFCGTYEEVMEKISGNATQNLINTMQMVEMQKELIESYQPHSKNHKIKKRRIIGLGGSRTTGAKGLKRVKDFSRSKSAPAGYGVLEEDDTEKPQKKIKIKIKSDLDEKKKRKSKRKGKKPGPKKGSKQRRSKKWGIYGGHYYDWSFLDSGDSGGDGGGGE